MKKAATLAVAGGVLQVIALFLPLHFQRPGVFGTAFPPGYPLRMEIAFALVNFTPTILVTGGSILLLLGEGRLAAGVLIAAGTFVLLESPLGPLFADTASRPRSFLLMAVELVAAFLLLAAGWIAARRPTISLPPSPLSPA